MTTVAPPRSSAVHRVVLAATILLLLLSSCGSRGTVVVALDEAFAAARPELARELLAGPGKRPWSGYRTRTLSLRLSDGAGAALAEIDAVRAAGRTPVALVTSPLIASALPGPWRQPWTEASSLGGAALLVPEWLATARLATARLAGLSPELSAPSYSSGVFALVETDPRPAYAAAGSAAGGYIASLGAAGGARQGSPTCAILFLEAASRPRSALEAFAAAYGEASGGGPPLVRELPASEDEDAAAEAAVRELLGSDIRLLFIALGSGGPAAIRAAARPGLVIGADFPDSEAPAALAFRVRPDDRGLARALWATLPDSRKGGGGAVSDTIPALLEAYSLSETPERKAFAPFLRLAMNRRESP